ncbi:MAG: fused MFS/spermidine synthase [Planctomycetes bacterium]|nr:fused MFS/spermidine synthase [Planctomycetota bacterium]
MSKATAWQARTPQGDASPWGRAPTGERRLVGTRSFWRMIIPGATAFFTGGCLMILVLAASRLMARSVGSSLYTWTSVVGVVLTGLSIGNYLGGRSADRYHTRRALAVLFGLSSAACVGMVVANNLAGEWLGLWRLNWPSHVLLHVLLVLLVPSTLLGAISPIVATMALDQGLASGRTIGSVYAWSAVGGIFGTFLAGFFLIAAFGCATILWFLGAAMLLVAVLYWISCWAIYLWAMVFMALAAMGMARYPWAQEAGTAALLRGRPEPGIVYEAETPYCHVSVQRVATRPEKRTFMRDRFPRGEMVVDDVTHLQDFHSRVFAALTRSSGGENKRLSLLVLGAGGYIFPRYLKATWPNTDVEVVENDPGVTTAAREAFGLDRYTAIETIRMDPRSYVDRLHKRGRRGRDAGRYDFVYEDALWDSALPFPLTTREFHDQIAGLLADDGMYMIHLIDARSSGQLLGAVVNTVREVFPHVYVIAEQAGRQSLSDTFVVVAAKRRLDPQAILREQDQHLRCSVLSDADLDDLKERCGGVILTDDYAPVDTLLAPAVTQGAPENLARQCLGKAREMQDIGRYEQSISWYRQAAQTDPAVAVEAYGQVGLMYVAQNKPQDAVTAFCRALQVHGETGSGQAAVGSVHMNLGKLLGRLDKPKEAKEQLTQAVEWFRIELGENPCSAALWESLGDTSATLGDFKGASDAFDQAMALEPRNPSHYEKLARALEFQHRYEAAAAVVHKHIDLMQEQGRRDLAGQLRDYEDMLRYKKVKQAKQAK